MQVVAFAGSSLPRVSKVATPPNSSKEALMARQIIEVSTSLFDILLRSQGSLRGELWQVGFDTPKLWRYANPRSILFEVDIDRYGLGHRPVLHDSVVTLAVVSAGAQPCTWPRPLPDDKTGQLLAVLQPVFESAEGLSGHQRLELAQAFDVACGARAIGPEPLSLLAPANKRQRRLRVLGLQLSRSFGAQLARLDQGITRYREEVREADLEECVAALSSHAELGIRLRLRPGSERGDSCMGLLATTRRASLEALMETVTGLSDATLHALARHAPHSGRHDLPITVADLAHVQSIVTNSAHRHTRNPWRTYDSGHPGHSRCAALEAPVPSVAVLNGVEQWIAASDRRRWIDVHPLIAATILHLDFFRLSPFERANRRIGRVLFQAQLYERGWPALPWHVAFERCHDDYLAALKTALAQRRHEPLLAFVLEACNIAISIGNEMVSALSNERKRLIAALASDGSVHSDEVKDYAEALLSGVFLEGFSSERGISNDRELLKRMHALEHIDCIRSPIGAVFSSATCRALMKASVHP
jgi:hypothetical protein